MLRSMRNPQDVFAGLLQKTQGTKASAYLLNTMRHLILIKEDGDQKIRYFQLIDKLISSIVTSDTPDLGQDFSRAFGVSVSHLVGRFVEQERMEAYIEEVKGLKLDLARVTREKMELAEEMGRDDLVATLKAQVLELEERLRKSRAATEAVTDQVQNMRTDYEARIADLELIIQELFNMLRESTHLETVQGVDDGPINRKQLIHDLREQWERKKTISKLEGRHRKRKTMAVDGKATPVESASDEEDAGEVLEAEKVALPEARGARVPIAARAEKKLSTGQFMDAEEERVRAHIEVALSKEADHVVSLAYTIALTSAVAHPRQRLVSSQHASTRRTRSTRSGTAGWEQVYPPHVQKTGSPAPIPRGIALCSAVSERVGVCYQQLRLRYR